MGKRLTTLADIAEELKLSKSAVSLALNGSKMVSEATKKKVLAAADKMGYIRNELVSSLMSNIKKASGEKFSETIALVNGNKDEYALVNHPTLPKYYAGIKDEADRLGYTLNEFWLHDPRFAKNGVAKILKSRGIRGGILLGHSFGNVFPPSFKSVWQDFHFISVGIKTYNPTLEMVSADHYAITNLATIKAIEMNFKRPALIMNEYIDELVDGRFIAGYMRVQEHFAPENRIPPFTVSDSLPEYAEKMYDWIEEYKPDVILYLLDSTREIILKNPKHKYKIPLIQLERRGYVKNWTGMEQNNDIVGRVAMRRLADMLSRSSAIVGENANMVTMVPPTWISQTQSKRKK